MKTPSRMILTSLSSGSYCFAAMLTKIRAIERCGFDQARLIRHNRHLAKNGIAPDGKSSLPLTTYCARHARSIADTCRNSTGSESHHQAIVVSAALMGFWTGDERKARGTGWVKVVHSYTLVVKISAVVIWA